MTNTIKLESVTFIQLSLFLDQHGKKGSAAPMASFAAPFRSWQVGYVLTSGRSSGDEEWTIQEINSPDNKPRREDCTIKLVNKAGEVREVKGSTAQSSYEFRSTGDVPPPPIEERSDVKPFGVNAFGVREFYPRAGGAEGTRLLMLDKTTYIVAESFQQIWEMLEKAGVSIGASKDRSKRKPVDGGMTGADPQQLVAG